MKARRVDRLTERAVRAKQIRGAYADGAGLYLHVSKFGTKAWMFRFKLAGKRRDMGLGGYPAVSLAEARQKAAQARKLRDAGLDPIAERSATTKRLRRPAL